jgi:hypothetical protein
VHRVVAEAVKVRSDLQVSGRNSVHDRSISERGQIKAVSDKRDQLGPQLPDPIYKCTSQLCLSALTNVRRTERVNAPPLRLAARD